MSKPQLCYHSPMKYTQNNTTLYFFSMQRRLWRVCTFSQAHLSLRPGTEISCADSNNDLCTVYKNSECCGEAAPATTYQCDYGAFKVKNNEC